MTYDLFIADRAFSSWSLRGWLMLEKFGLPHRVHVVGLYDGTMEEDMAPLAPARLVPVVRTPEGDVIGESLAIAETLAERHPEAGLWPADRAARAAARWLAAEMHAGFGALRSACPMQLHSVYEGFEPPAAVTEDLARIEELFAHARGKAASGPWLLGAYSLADVFYAPVAARIVGYGLAAGPLTTAFTEATLAEPAFRRWRAEGIVRLPEPIPYLLDLPRRPWPEVSLTSP
ncbi:hypothetical protein OG2516_07787 [Oceanicola granulosus HTCC2516]|uniref:GST N-terminal domain-containing protein n=1 Tax=Oceanicola granulosus (strain ATCC BAA-861 / DSM 15982 / KCTC 12143 / HTCC2516) TaxID=314256 RepID=Q2CI97_OCEGH|nr:glutathione S-transferase N-terminal domain-containing protein [Oceanicola granulosus]EAR52361.1 hypothetical protein OG2516_07787 [Oceanicola granulosus HTCC2516]